MIRTFLLAAALLLGGASARAAGSDSLEAQMQALDLPGRAPIAVASQKFYSVQTRPTPLALKHELTVGAGYDLVGDPFLNSEQIDVGYRFHIDDRWSIAAHRSAVFNQLTSAAARVQNSTGATPTAPFVLARTDLMGEVNVFYGKLRVSSERAFYFDQYVALGAAFVEMNNGSSAAAAADIGAVGYFGRSLTARLGFRDHLGDQWYPSGPTLANSLTAHFDLGVLL